MPAVHIEESDLKPSADTLKRNPQLRSIKGGGGESKGERSGTRAKGERAGTKSTADDSRTYPKLRQARGQAAKRGRVTVGRTRARVGRVAVRQANRGAASIGSILLLLTGVGVTFAIIRRPQIITGPLGFITAIFGRFVALFGGGSARNVAT